MSSSAGDSQQGTPTSPSRALVARWNRRVTSDALIWPKDGPGFRSEQHRWRSEFPFAEGSALNRLCVHPAVVDFARRALETSDLRIYQAQALAKYTGDTNYEQPMHTDRNHSWLPAHPDPRWWHVEASLYLSDVHDANAPAIWCLSRTRLDAARRFHSSCPIPTPRSTRRNGPHEGGATCCWRTGPTYYKAPRISTSPGSAVPAQHELQDRGTGLNRVPRGAISRQRAGLDGVRGGLDARRVGALRLPSAGTSDLGRGHYRLHR